MRGLGLKGAGIFLREIESKGPPIEYLGPQKKSIGEPRCVLSLGIVKEVMASNNYSSLGENVVKETWLLSSSGVEVDVDAPKA
jgi:hypothetical protein